MNYEELKKTLGLGELTNKQLLETAAVYMRECAADPEIEGETWFPPLMTALAEWLEIESQRHIDIGPLDSGYEQVSYWDSPILDPEVAMMEPCIRVANIFIEQYIEAAAEEPEVLP